MFFTLVSLGLMSMFFYLWGDYMKLLILLEITALMFLCLLMYYLKMDLLSLNFFFSTLIFLVCESSMGFILFIYYISMESEVVKKMNLSQF